MSYRELSNDTPVAVTPGRNRFDPPLCNKRNPRISIAGVTKRLSKEARRVELCCVA